SRCHRWRRNRHALCKPVVSPAHRLRRARTYRRGREGLAGVAQGPSSIRGPFGSRAGIPVPLGTPRCGQSTPETLPTGGTRKTTEFGQIRTRTIVVLEHVPVPDDRGASAGAGALVSTPGGLGWGHAVRGSASLIGD